MLAIGFKLPSGLLVLNRSVIVLKSGIAFLPRLLFLAILIEPADSKIGTISTCLTGLGVKPAGKGVFFCQGSAVSLQVVFKEDPFIPAFKGRGFLGRVL